jgi:hypothetical protein
MIIAITFTRLTDDGIVTSNLFRAKKMTRFREMNMESTEKQFYDDEVIVMHKEH